MAVVVLGVEGHVDAGDGWGEHGGAGAEPDVE